SSRCRASSATRRAIQSTLAEVIVAVAVAARVTRGPAAEGDARDRQRQRPRHGRARSISRDGAAAPVHVEADPAAGPAGIVSGLGTIGRRARVAGTIAGEQVAP